MVVQYTAWILKLLFCIAQKDKRDFFHLQPQHFFLSCRENWDILLKLHFFFKYWDSSEMKCAVILLYTGDFHWWHVCSPRCKNEFNICGLNRQCMGWKSWNICVHLVGFRCVNPLKAVNLRPRSADHRLYTGFSSRRQIIVSSLLTA